MDKASDGKGITYDPQTNTYRVFHDWTNPEPVSATLLETVAIATGRDLLALDPLYDTIDVDAVDRLYEPRPGATQQPDGGCLTFSFAGCEVTLYWDGKIVATPD